MVFQTLLTLRFVNRTSAVSTDWVILPCPLKAVFTLYLQLGVITTSGWTLGAAITPGSWTASLVALTSLLVQLISSPPSTPVFSLATPTGEPPQHSYCISNQLYRIKCFSQPSVVLDRHPPAASQQLDAHAGTWGSSVFNMRVSAPRFYFFHLILCSCDYNMHVEENYQLLRP